MLPCASADINKYDSPVPDLQTVPPDRDLRRGYSSGKGRHGNNIGHSWCLQQDASLVIQEADVILDELACRWLDLNFIG